MGNMQHMGGHMGQGMGMGHMGHMGGSMGPGEDTWFWFRSYGTTNERLCQCSLCFGRLDESAGMQRLATLLLRSIVLLCTHHLVLCANA